MAMELMQKRLLTNAVLVLGLAALGLFLWLGPEPDPKPGPLTPIDKSQVQFFTIERLDRPPIRIERRDRRWHITKPVDVAADSDLVARFLNLLDARPLKQYAPGELDLQELHLDPAFATITVDGGHVLRIGGLSPIERKRYLLYNDTLYLLDDTHYPLISRGLYALINPSLLPPERTAAAFRLPEFSIARSESGWTLEPAQNKPSVEVLKRWVDRWRNTEATLVERKTVELKGDEPTVIVAFENGEPLTYRLIDTGDGRALYRPDSELVYQLVEQDLNALLSPPEPAAAPEAKAPTATG